MSGTRIVGIQYKSAGPAMQATVAETYGGLGAVAAEAGISREALYRALSAKGNPDPQDDPRGAQGRRDEVVG